MRLRKIRELRAFAIWSSSGNRHTLPTVAALSKNVRPEEAERLFAGVLDAYRDRAGRDPLRLVIHKTSAYTDEEREGIGRALSTVSSC